MERLLENLRNKVNLFTGTSSGRRDYRKYKWKRGELIRVVAESCAVVILLSYFFYRNVWSVFLLSPIGVLFFKEIFARKSKECREKLTAEFKECILSVSASMKAGYAVENAFLESRGDMKLLFGENSIIYNELELIRRGLIINITLEELLGDLADRSGSDEIYQFAQIFAIAKRNGGNISEIIRTSSELISMRIETRQEIHTILSGRRMEQNIMKLMPFGILSYIGISYPGYFDSLYHNVQGGLIMSICLMIYIFAYVTGDGILNRIEAEMM